MTDDTTIRRVGVARWLIWPAMLAGMLAGAAGADAQVTLETAVSKVESTLDAAGRVKRELVTAEQVVPGEELRYTITFSNHSETVVDPGRIVITNAIPDGTVYMPDTAGGDSCLVEYSIDGETFMAVESAAPPDGSVGSGPAEDAPGADAAPAAGTGDGPMAESARSDAVQSLRWTYQQALQPGQSGQVYFHVRMQ